MLTSQRSRGFSNSFSSVRTIHQALMSSSDMSQSSRSRKYQGEPHDPHYVPKSPLIERRHFSAEDEAELKSLCTLALSKVPHSDEMTDDPFRYLAKHISTRQTTRPVKQHEPQRQERDIGSSIGSTTPSSITSRREASQPYDATPMTTPGITPAETTKRFSDAVRSRPATAAPSQLRTEVKTFKGNAVYSFLSEPAAMQRPRTSSATKSLTNLSHLASVAKTKTHLSTDSKTKQSSKSGMFKQPNFNKSLPSLPRIRTKEQTPELIAEESPVKQRGNTISRMLKSVRLQKAQTAPVMPVRGTSADGPRYLNQFEDSAEPVSARKQRRFNISHIFSKNGGAKRATVC